MEAALPLDGHRERRRGSSLGLRVAGVLAVLGLGGFLAAGALGKNAARQDQTTTAPTTTSPPPTTMPTTIPAPDPPPVVKRKPATQTKRTVATPVRPRTVTHAAPPPAPPPPAAKPVRRQPPSAAAKPRAQVAKPRAPRAKDTTFVAVRPAVIQESKARARVVRRPRTPRHVTRTPSHMPRRPSHPVRQQTRGARALDPARARAVATAAIARVPRLRIDAPPITAADRPAVSFVRWLALLVIGAATLLTLAMLAPVQVIPERLAVPFANRRLGLGLFGLQVALACGLALLLAGPH